VLGRDGYDAPMRELALASGCLVVAPECRLAPEHPFPAAPMLDATASSASYEEFAEGYGFSSAKSRWYFDRYLPPGVDRRAPRVSPLFEPVPEKLPATLIVTAECDPLRDDGERHAKRLRTAGVDVELRRYPGMIHGFFQMTAALEGSRRLHRELRLAP
jgi:acetyl esterase/lipase